MALLNPHQIQDQLSALDGWSLDKDTIRKTFKFATFGDGISFVNRVAKIAEAADHHPDFNIRYTDVELALSSHSAGGLTQADFDLARQIG